MNDIDFKEQTKNLIDSLKSVCANYGLGNDGNEFKIITQMFLYKFINDKFTYEAKKNNPTLTKSENFQTALEKLTKDDLLFLQGTIGNSAPKIGPKQTISFLFSQQNKPDFDKLLDDTLREISIANEKLLSVKSSGGAKIKLFDELSQFISDQSQRDAFCKALIGKCVEFSFEKMFSQKYDFFATIFEYLIKDYNTDSGGKYAEYYTPHAVAHIMADILVNEANVKSVTCYDPSAGSGTLLMNIAHAIGEKNCSIYSEDISQKSSNMLRLNLILNNLSHSIENIIKTNTIAEPFYLDKKFDYIVSNPPFKLDFSDFVGTLGKDEFKQRFFAGIPNVPKAKKESMSIYLMFIQHIMYSLSKKGKAAVVVPTGFITAQSGIEKNIRKALIERNMLRGVVSMPSNIFASTGTNVSVLFIDMKADAQHITLVDASKLGTTIKEGKNQRTVLSAAEEQRIIYTMNAKNAEDDFSVVLSTDDIIAKNYSFSAGQYFDVKIEYTDITAKEFEAKMKSFTDTLDALFAESSQLEKEIKQNLKSLKFEN
jgi:type I restriction enzyme M protein